MEPEEELQWVFKKTVEIIKKAGLTENPTKIEAIEIADFGLSENTTAAHRSAYW